MREIDRRIMKALSENANVPANIADELSVTRQYMYRQLNELVDSGEVKALGRGVYSVTEGKELSDSKDADEFSDSKRRHESALNIVKTMKVPEKWMMVVYDRVVTFQHPDRNFGATNPPCVRAENDGTLTWTINMGQDDEIERSHVNPSIAVENIRTALKRNGEIQQSL